MEKKTILIKTPEERANELARKLSCFESFQALLDAKGGYRPSLAVSLEPEALELAILYDAAQELRGDPRRASRY